MAFDSRGILIEEFFVFPQGSNGAELVSFTQNAKYKVVVENDETNLVIFPKDTKDSKRVSVITSLDESTFSIRFGVQEPSRWVKISSEPKTSKELFPSTSTAAHAKEPN